MEVIQKHVACVEYYICGKDGHQLFIFRREFSKWRFVYGYVTEELRESILDALIMKFQWDVVKTFMYKGESQNVTVTAVNDNAATRHLSSPEKGSSLVTFFRMGHVALY